MREIIAQYENNCNHLVKLFAEKQGLDFDFWVSDIIGGVASFSWHYFFTIDDIVIDLKTKQEKGLILEWHESGIENNPLKINYYSYTKGLRYKDLKK